MPKLCINCTYSRRRVGFTKDHYLCFSPHNVMSITSLVTGQPYKRYETCEDARDSKQGCAEDGFWFVARAELDPLGNLKSPAPKQSSGTFNAIKLKKIEAGDL